MSSSMVVFSRDEDVHGFIGATPYGVLRMLERYW